MCGVAAGVTGAVGAVLLVAASVLQFSFVPDLIESLVIDSTVLINGSEQWERFEAPPFPLQCTIRFFNVTNPEEVLAGEPPHLDELPPYVYKMYIRRVITDVGPDTVHYRRLDHFEFDTEASFPNREDDPVTIMNVPYLAVMQTAETVLPALMPALNLAANSVFGASKNSPIATYKVQELVLQGYKLCEQPGLVGGVACAQIRALSGNARNLQPQEDGSLLFSLLGYRHDVLSSEFEVSRGLAQAETLGEILAFEGAPVLSLWPAAAGGPVPPDPAAPGACNRIRGTDSNIFQPFLDKSPLYALNTDICRTVELRWEGSSSYEGVPSYLYAAREWLHANEEGCFCVNTTRGAGAVVAADGCLLPGAIELINCVGGPLVLSNPHFLYAAEEYRAGVVGLRPDRDDHVIKLEVEPYTGTPLQGYKRAQFNVFARPLAGVPATQRLPSTLTPVFWIEESLALPEEFVAELHERLVTPLRIAEVALPVLFAVAAALLAVAAGLVTAACVRARRRRSEPPPPTPPAT